MEELAIHKTVNMSRCKPMLCCAVLHIQLSLQACVVLAISLGYRID